MKRLVADAGPILHLHEAGGLHLLPGIGEVTCPSVVLAEIRIHAPALWTGALPPWFTSLPLSVPASQRARNWQQAGLLYGGEAAALALASEMHSDWFITDDAAARLMAESLGIETHGSLGIVLWSAAKHMIGKQEAEQLLQGLENSSLWLSPLVRARTACGKTATRLCLSRRGRKAGRRDSSIQSTSPTLRSSVPIKVNFRQRSRAGVSPA